MLFLPLAILGQYNILSLRIWQGGQRRICLLSRMASGEPQTVHMRPATYSNVKQIHKRSGVNHKKNCFRSSWQFPALWGLCSLCSAVALVPCGQLRRGCWRQGPGRCCSSCQPWRHLAPCLALRSSSEMLAACFLHRHFLVLQCSGERGLQGAGRGLQPLVPRFRNGSIALGVGQCEWQRRYDRIVATFFWSLPIFLKQAILWTLFFCLFVSPGVSSFPWVSWSLLWKGLHFSTSLQKVSRLSWIWEWTWLRFK